MANQPKSYKKFLASTMTAAMVASAVVPAAGFAAEATKDFSDVPANHWAKASIDYLVGKGALEGREDGKFYPNDSITRGEAAKILSITLGLKIEDSAKANFKDTEKHWSSKYVAAIQSQKVGVINGYEDGTFRPNNKITRQEMAKMIVKAYDLKLDGNTDVSFEDNTGWGAEFVNVLASIGVVEGVSEGKFAPKAHVTRAQTPVFVHRTEVEDVRVEVPTADKVAPTVENIYKKDNGVYVTFDEKVESSSAVSAANYAYVVDGIGSIDLPEDTKLTLLSGGKIVKIEFPANWKVGKLEHTIADVTKLQIKNVLDLAGNKITQTTKSVDAAHDIATVDSDAITAVTTKKIEVKLSETGVLPADAAGSDFVVKAGNETLSVEQVEINSKDRKLVLTLAEELTADAKYNKSAISVGTVAKPVVTKTADGRDFVFGVDAPITAQDKISAEVKEVKSIAGGITVEFNEDLKDASIADNVLSDIIITDVNGSRVNLDSGNISEDNGFVTIKGIKAGDNYKVEVVPSVLVDEAGNKVAAYSSTDTVDVVATAVVSTPEDLKFALTNPAITNVELIKDITVTEPLSVANNQTLTVTDGAKLTIQNGVTFTVPAGAKLTGAGSVENNGTIAFGEFTSKNVTIKSYAGSTITIDNETGKNLIGTNGLNVTEGYIVISDNGTGTSFTLPKDSKATINGAFMDTIAYRIAKNDALVIDGTLTVNTDMNVTGKVVVNGTLDVASGKTLTLKSVASSPETYFGELTLAKDATMTETSTVVGQDANTKLNLQKDWNGLSAGTYNWTDGAWKSVN